MGHLSWNVAAAFLAAMPDVVKHVKVHRGIPRRWDHLVTLRGLATRSRADGGLGLMEPLGEEAQTFFKNYQF